MSNHYQEIKPVELQNSLIRDLSQEDKPREKALRQGIKALSEAELLAILFSTGIKGKSVLDLSRDILAHNNGHLSQLARFSPQELMKQYKGIGIAKAISLLAALELGLRSQADAEKMRHDKIQSSQQAFRLMAHRLKYLDHEEFWVLYLNQQLQAIRDVRIGMGGLSATYVDVKIIIREALTLNASAMILCHNHPSGNLQPSAQDDSLTRRISDAANILDLRVADHLIITDGKYYSYQDEGRMPQPKKLL